MAPRPGSTMAMTVPYLKLTKSEVPKLQTHLYQISYMVSSSVAILAQEKSIWHRVAFLYCTVLSRVVFKPCGLNFSAGATHGHGTATLRTRGGRPPTRPRMATRLGACTRATTWTTSFGRTTRTGLKGKTLQSKAEVLIGVGAIGVNL